MYCKTDTLQNIYTYDFNDKYVCVLTKDNYIKIINEKSEILLYKLSSSCHLIVFNDYVYVSDNNNEKENFMISLKSKVVEVDFNIYNASFLNFNNSKLTNFFAIHNVDSSVSIYDMVENTIIYTYEKGFSLENYITPLNSYFITRYDKNLICFNKGNKIWETCTSQKSEIVKILGQLGNKLWIWCENYWIICLDTNTGKVIYSWQPFKEVFEDGQFYFNFPHFDEKSCKVLFFERSYFIECDLESQTAKVIWKDDAVNLNIGSGVFTEDSIYFVSAERNKITANILGVFSRHKNKIAWMEKINLGNFITLKELRVNGDKIYVLDTGGTLHIYEKGANIYNPDR